MMKAIKVWGTEKKKEKWQNAKINNVVNTLKV